jgi:large subunit ribosomal protein L29
MKPRDIREKRPDELKKELDTLRDRLFKLRLQKSMGQLKETASIKNTKKDIARIKTILLEMTKAS